MTSPDLDSLLPTAFRDFLFEVREVERDIEGEASRSPAETRRRLAGHLEQLKATVLSPCSDPLPQDDQRALEQALRLMAAVADSKLAGLWGQKRLEDDDPSPEIGHFVPERLKRLLAEEAGDCVAEEHSPAAPPAATEEILVQAGAVASDSQTDQPDSEMPPPALAEVYLLALAATGPPETAGELPESELRERQLLWSVLEGRDSGLAAEPERLFPDAYPRHQRRGPAPLLPEVRRWALALVVLLGVLLLGSAYLWSQSTTQFRQAVQQLLTPGD